MDITTKTNADRQLSAVLVHLLKGILYRDIHTQLWQGLLQQESSIKDQLKILGLNINLDEEEGYAFVVQQIAEDDQPEIPRLVARRALNYPVSLLCVLLRKRLAESDHQGGDVKLVVNRQDLHNDMCVFFSDQSNEARFADQLNGHIEKVVKLGFLKSMKEKDHFEVRRIIKSLVDGDWLADVNEKLAVYRQHEEA
jgi:uncharacterized protein DUF4194